MKLFLKGNVFNPTGMARVNRELARALLKQKVEVQTSDIYHSGYEFNKGLDVLNKPIDIKDADTLLSDYPQFWNTRGGGKVVGHWIHEGTKLPEGYAEMINRSGISKLWVASKAVYNLFKWNNVKVPMTIIPFGVNENFKPMDFEDLIDDYIFLSVNSWTGELNDRKGTDVLIKAFNEEFKDEEVKLVLKITTPFQDNSFKFYADKVAELCGGKINPNILINIDYIEDKEIAEIMAKSDCFVSPTRGEGFGLSILEAMACGLPVIVTNDKNSGHMDFAKGESVLWIDAPKVVQGDLKFFAKGNMLADPDVNSLRKQLRYAYENRKDLSEKALKKSEEIREEYTWDRTAKEVLKLYE